MDINEYQKQLTDAIIAIDDKENMKTVSLGKLPVDEIVNDKLFLSSFDFTRTTDGEWASDGSWDEAEMTDALNCLYTYHDTQFNVRNRTTGRMEPTPLDVVAILTENGAYDMCFVD